MGILCMSQSTNRAESMEIKPKRFIIGSRSGTTHLITSASKGLSRLQKVRHYTRPARRAKQHRQIASTVDDYHTDLEYKMDPNGNQCPGAKEAELTAQG